MFNKKCLKNSFSRESSDDKPTWTGRREEVTTYFWVDFFPFLIFVLEHFSLALLVCVNFLWIIFFLLQDMFAGNSFFGKFANQGQDLKICIFVGGSLVKWLGWNQLNVWLTLKMNMEKCEEKKKITKKCNMSPDMFIGNVRSFVCVFAKEHATICKYFFELRYNSPSFEFRDLLWCCS